MNRIVIILSFLLIISCKNSQVSQHLLKGKIFGTYYIIQLDCNKEKLPQLKSGIDSVFTKINQSLNTYIASSDISKINRGDSTVIVDKMFREVFLLSDSVYRKTGGFFDPTIGNLRNSYGFGDTKPIKKFSQKKLDSLMKFVGWDKVKLLENNKIKKKFPEIYLDFNAIAKGYAIDKLITYLSSKDIENISIEIGGEIRVLGLNSLKNRPWHIGIESSTSNSDDRKTRDLIVLQNKAIAGSGNFRKNRIDPLTGKKYVHTINPITGKAEQGSMLSSYVIANNCAVADAYATSFMAMDIENSKKIIASIPEIDVYLVYSDTDGNIKTFITEGFKKIILR